MKIKYASIYKPDDRARRDDPWLIALSIGSGKRIVVRGTTDKTVTTERAMKLSALVQRVRMKLIPIAQLHIEIGGNKTINEHLEEWEKSIISSGASQKHAKQFRKYATDALAGFAMVGQIIWSTVAETIEGLKGSRDTKNRYVDAVRSFIAWGASARQHRWAKEVHDNMDLPKQAGGKKKKRRVLALHDLRELLTHAPEDRRTLYRFVLATALRANEVRQLLPSDLDGTLLHVRREVAKNRKESWHRIPAAVATAVHKQGGKLLFPTFNQRTAAQRMRRDLKRAGIDYKTDVGVFDFHSLRHQSGALMCFARMTPKAVQQHMRHSSIQMTLDTYGHLFDEEKDRAAEVATDIDQRVTSNSDSALRSAFGASGVVRGRSRSVTSKEIDVKTAKNSVERRGIEPRFAECDEDHQVVLTLIDNELASVRGKRVAPRAAQRVLKRFHNRAMSRARSRSK